MPIFFSLPCLTTSLPRWDVPPVSACRSSAARGPACAARSLGQTSLTHPMAPRLKHPPHLVRFPHQWPRCTLIKAKPFLAAQTFAYQRISLGSHPLKRFSVPTPLPAPQLSLAAQGERENLGFKVPLRVPAWDALTHRKAPRCLCSSNQDWSCPGKSCFLSKPWLCCRLSASKFRSCICSGGCK